jgi:hypothetical protein
MNADCGVISILVEYPCGKKIRVSSVVVTCLDEESAKIATNAVVL